MLRLGFTAFLFVFILMLPVGVNFVLMFDDPVQDVTMTPILEEEEERDEASDEEDECKFMIEDLAYLYENQREDHFFNCEIGILQKVHFEVFTPPPEIS